MRLVVTAISLLILSVNVHSFSLKGAWQSDRQKTLEWNSQYRKVEENYLSKLATVLGSHVMVYGEGSLCQFLMPQEYSHGSTKVPIYGMTFGRSRYEIITQNKYGFVVRQTSEDGTENVSMLIFESDESFYGVALDTEDFGQPGSREYYKRIELPKTVNWEAGKCYEP